LLKKPAFGAKLEEFRGEYFGGHPAYPKKQDVHIVLEEESLIIPELNLSLPYRSLKKIENITGEKISAARVALFGAVGLGTVGALWKKEQTYMVLTYHDKEASSNLGLVFKVPHIEKVQPLIYKKMIEAKK
jgi:hypothetical protein